MIAALDIGTSKVAALIAEIDEHQKIHVIGVGVQPSTGLKKGVIVNIDTTVSAISKAVEEAEHMAGLRMRGVCVGIAGAHVRSFNSNGVVAVRGQEVSHIDVERVIEAAKAMPIAVDQRILHIIPQEFLIDNQAGIREPVGMSGVRLEAKVHIVTGAVSAAQNIVKCVHQCGLSVEDLVIEQLASSYAVVSEDEKELGVVLLDIGGGTTDISIFTEGAIRYTASIPIAGSQVTSDIAHALRTPTQYAEAIKLQHGVALTRLANPDESIEVRSVGDRPARRLAMQTLAGVIEARYEELLTLVDQEIRASGFSAHIAAGVVLTGGGSKIPGVLALAEEVFRMPVRLGVPDDISGMTEVVCSPEHATGIGLLKYQVHQRQENTEMPAPLESDERSVWQKMKGWFSRHF